MKVPLGVAAALHAMALLAGARWAPHAEARAPVTEIEPAIIEVPVETVAPPPDDKPSPASRVIGAGGGVRAADRSPGTGAARPRPALPMVATGAPAPLLTTSKTSPVEIAAPEPSKSEDQTGPLGASAGTGDSAAGDGDGHGGGKAGAKPGTPWTDSWDHAVGPKGGLQEEKVAKAEASTLSPGTIASVVARSAGRVRACYQAGLRREPDLAGHIPVQFVVDLQGNVVVAKDAGSTVADPTTIRCVLAIFATMAFPARTTGPSVSASHLIVLPPG